MPVSKQDLNPYEAPDTVIEKKEIMVKPHSFRDFYIHNQSKPLKKLAIESITMAIPLAGLCYLTSTSASNFTRYLLQTPSQVDINSLGFTAVGGIACTGCLLLWFSSSIPLATKGIKRLSKRLNLTK